MMWRKSRDKLSNSGRTKELSASRITFIYVIIAVLWIFFTDQIIASWAENPNLLTQIQSYKGWLYVLVTGLGLYLLIRYQNRQVEQKILQTNKSSINNALEAANVATWDFDARTGRVNRSRRHHRIFGYKKQPPEWNLNIFRQHIHPKDRERVRQHLDEAINNKTDYHIEHRINRVNGETRWVLSRGTPKVDAEGKVVRISGIVSDITEQKKLEQAHKRDRELMEKLFDRIPVMIVIYNPSIDSFRVNKGYERVLGWTADDDQNGSLLEKCYPDPEYRKEVVDFMSNPDTGWQDFTVTAKSGKKVDSSWTNIRLSDDTQVGIGVDISERKQYEQNLQLHRNRLAKAQQIARIGYWYYYPLEGRLEWSDMVYELFGLDPDDFTPTRQALLEHLHPDDREKLKAAQEKGSREGYLEIDYRLIKPNGDISYFQERGKVAKWDREGKPVEFSGTVLDITELKKAEIHVRKSRQLLKKTFESLKEGVLIIDPETRTIVECNKEIENIFGYRRDELIGQTTEMLHLNKKKFIDFDRLSKKDLQEKGIFRHEYRMRRKDDSSFHSDHTVTLVYTDTGSIDRVVSVVRDISERKKFVRTLKQSERTYRHMFEQNPQPMWIFDPDTLAFREVNNAAIHHYGYSKEEFLSMTIEEIRPESDIGRVRESVVENRGSSVYNEEWKHITKDGTEIFVEISAADINYEGKNLRLVTARDITLRKKTRERIIRSVVEGEDRERKRIARELHDGLGQYLAAAHMNLQSIGDNIQVLHEKRVDQFKKGLGLLRHAIEEIKSIAKNLMPRVIEDYGLITALETLFDNVRKSSDIHFNFSHTLNGSQLEKHMEVNLYRIMQEAVSNAVKHSECSTVSVEIYEQGSHLICTIEDDGVGTDLNIQHEAAGLGLRSMRTRVDAMSGSIEINTAPGKGMVITIILPFN